jgi:hypothetical protein
VAQGSAWLEVPDDRRHLLGFVLRLASVVVELLQVWPETSPWNGDDDYLFPSVRHNGAHPLWPDMILRRYILPALEALGIHKQIGWHSFRMVSQPCCGRVVWI